MKRERDRERERARARARAHRRESDPGLWLLVLCVFPPPGPSLCKLGKPGVLFVLPEILTLVLRPSFVLFHGLSPSLSFSHRLSGLLFPILTT